MTAPQASIGAALKPIREALLAAARADAERLETHAEAEAAEIIAGAQAQADAMLADGHERGAAEAATAAAAELSRARRQARSAVLRAQRQAYEALLAGGRAAAAGLRDEPGYPDVRDRLVAAARHALGSDALIVDADGGGIVGHAPGRRLDLSLSTLAERAAQTVAGEDS